MSDRELLELAAKAAGIVLEYEEETDRYFYRRNPYDLIRNGQSLKVFWNPRDDDGDAFRLRAKLGLSIDVIKFGDGKTATLVSMPMPGRPIAEPPPVAYEYHDPDPAAAARHAIFRVAVEIGKIWGGTLLE